LTARSAELAKRQRADALLVARGLAATGEEARRSIMAGDVSTEGRRVDKAGELLPVDALLRAKESSRYVSRGGQKLEHGLDAFGVDPAGRVCLDAGCSTGGFTDCLLQRGARLVHAVDVGYGQLAWSLRSDPRVLVRERTNVRTVAPETVRPVPDLVVADLAFVSLAGALPALVGLAQGAAEFVLLVKPQFELPREKVTDGVVRDQALHREAVRQVVNKATELGLESLSEGAPAVESPLIGPEGNREFLVGFRRGAG
jgi:23S rRNA (cytidine1920-2'-O)/16S rRNA (cytidine1409-2'-O)-methyltransferase